MSYIDSSTVLTHGVNRLLLLCEEIKSVESTSDRVVDIILLFILQGIPHIAITYWDCVRCHLVALSLEWNWHIAPATTYIMYILKSSLAKTIRLDIDEKYRPRDYVSMIWPLAINKQLALCWNHPAKAMSTCKCIDDNESWSALLVLDVLLNSRALTFPTKPNILHEKCSCGLQVIDLKHHQLC